LEQAGDLGTRRLVANAKPHVYFNFTSSGWAALARPMPAVVSALGGDELELVSMGEGFDVTDDQGYRLLLTSRYDTSYSQTFACREAASYRTISCPLGKWHGPGGQVLVQLLRGSLLVGKTSDPVYLNMTAGWDAIDLTSAVVSGGARVVFRGGGFVSGSSLQCSWAMSDGSSFTVNAEVLNGSAILCLSPDVSDTHMHDDAMLVFKFASGEHVPELNPGYSSEHGIAFSFTACWYHSHTFVASTAEPQLQIVAQAGSWLQIFGAGFGSYNYSIEFSRQGASVVVSKPCGIVRRSKLECETPQWNFSADSDADSFYFQEVNMRLLYASSLFVVQIGQPQRTVVSRAFITSMKSASTAFQFQASSHIAVSAGGDELIVLGEFPCYNVTIPCIYVCSFNQDNISETTTIRTLVSSHSPSALRCPTPALTSFRVMSVVVYTVSFLPIAVVGNITTRIVFKSMIKSIAPRRISSSLGATVTVIGSDFEADPGDYKCVFVFPSGHQRAAATVQSSTTLICAAPALPLPEIANSVPVHIEKCTAMLDQSDRTCTAITWEDTSELSRIIYVAEFGLAASKGFADAGILWLNGRGVNYTSGNDHRLVFAGSTSDQMIAPVTVLKDDSSARFAYATLPLWAFAEASTQVTLEQRVAGAGKGWQSVQPFTPADAIYQFRKVVRNVVSLRIPAMGCASSCWPAKVVLDTGAIDAGDGALICKFVARVSKRIVFSQEVSSTSSVSITCVVSELDYAAEIFDVSLIQSGFTISFALQAQTSILFSDQITKVSPLSRPASGGLLFAIQGFGFTGGQATFGGRPSYLCLFSDHEQRHEKNTSAWVESSVKIICPAPYWQYVAKAVSLSIVKTEEDIGTAQKRDRGKLLVHLTPVWWFSSVPSGSFRGGVGLHPSPGYDLNTPMLTFTGVGFNTTLSYYAEFTAVNSQGILYSAQSPASNSFVLSSEKILVQVPAFDAGMGVASVTLFSCVGAACVSVAKERGVSTAHPSAQVLNNFYFVGHLIGFNRTVFSRGQRLFVTGDAFAIQKMHYLVVSSAIDVGMNVRVSAETVSANSLSFELPVWPYTAGSVYAKVFQDEAEIRWHSIAPSFEYEETFLKVDPSSGPAHGPIFIQGLGIRAESGYYSCIIRNSSGFSERYPGRQISLHNLSCSTASNFDGNVSVFLVKESGIERILKTNVLSNSTFLQINQASSAPGLRLGTLLLLDGEIMEVTANSDNNHSVTVHRGRYRTPQRPHATSTLIHVLVRPYSCESPPCFTENIVEGSIISEYLFRPSFSFLSPREALISGAAVISVVGHLLKTGPQESYRCRFTTASGEQLISARARAEQWNDDSQIVRCLVTVPASWTEQEAVISLLSSSNEIFCSNSTFTTCNPAQYSSGSRFFFSGLIKRRNDISGVSFQQSFITFETVGLISGSSNYSCTFSNSFRGSVAKEKAHAYVSGGYLSCPSPLRAESNTEYITISRASDATSVSSARVLPTTLCVLPSVVVAAPRSVTINGTLCTSSITGTYTYLKETEGRPSYASAVNSKFLYFSPKGRLDGIWRWVIGGTLGLDGNTNAYVDSNAEDVSGIVETWEEYCSGAWTSSTGMSVSATALTSQQDDCVNTNVSLLLVDTDPHEYYLIEMSLGALSPAKLPSGGIDRVFLSGGGHNRNGSYYCVFEVATQSAVWTPATASFNEISCPTPSGNRSVWNLHFRKQFPEVRFHVLSGAYIGNGSSHLVPVKAFRFSCLVASKVSSWGLVVPQTSLQWLQPETWYQPRFMSCSGDKFIRFEGAQKHLTAAPVFLQPETNGGLTIATVVKLVYDNKPSSETNETIVQGNQVASAGSSPEIFLGRTYDVTTRKSQLLVKVGDCTATSNLAKIPQAWMTLVLGYFPLNSTTCLIRLTKNAELIASALCNTPMIVDESFLFEVGSSTGPGLNADLGVAFVVDRVLSELDIAFEIQQQQQVLGYSKVPSQQMAVAEFLPFQFRSAILSVLPSIAISAGGTPVYVSAVYFDVDGIYSCVFSSPTNEIASECKVVNATTAVCIFPAWNRYAGTALLRVVTHSPATLPVSGALFFEIQQHWSTLDPSCLLSDGGYKIQMTGSGFKVTSSYTCHFTRRMESMTSACTVFNTTHMDCSAPAWGMNFSGSWGVAPRASAADDPVMVTLMSEGSSVLRLDIGNLSLVKGCDSLACPVNFVESVDNRGQKAIDRSQGPATGGWSVIVAGYGFHANSTFQLNFSAAGSGHATSAPCVLLSSSRLRCKILPWGFEAADAYATLLVHPYGNSIECQDPSSECDGGSISFPSPVYQQGEDPIIIRMRVVWTAAATYSGMPVSAKGGDQIHVYGAGFSQNSTSSSGFVCLLVRGEHEAMTAARWLSSSHLVCVAPQWPFAFGEANISMYQMREMCSAVVSCSGTCSCKSAYPLGAMEGTISEGSGDYGPNARCEWILSSPCSAIKLEVDVDTEACCDYLMIVDYKTGKQVARLSGNTSGTYTVESGQVRMIFESDASNPMTSLHAGFTAKWQVSAMSKNFLDPVPHVGGNSSIFYRQIWVEVTINLTTREYAEGPSSGGFDVYILGFGFDVATAYYKCLFFRSISSVGNGVGSESGSDGGADPNLTNAQMSASAQVVTTSVIKCQAPEWGKAFSSIGPVTVALQYKNESFIFCSSENSSACQLSFQMVVSNISSRQGGNSSIELVVNGHGFDVRQNYCLSEHICYKILRISLMEIIFEKPDSSSFPHEFALALNGPSGQDKEQLAHVLFFFEKYWHRHNISRAAAWGGTKILIEGFGFRSESQFICKFSYGSSHVQSIALVTDLGSSAHQNLTCTTPYWPFAHGKVSLSIHEAIMQGNNTAVFSQTVPFVSMTASATVFEFVQGLEKLIQTEIAGTTSPTTLNGTLTGPSSGGSSVLIRGYGLNVNARYLCTFWRVVGSPLDSGSWSGSDSGEYKTKEFMSSNATVVSHMCIFCRTPEWGAAFSFGNVTVSVTYEDESILSCGVNTSTSCSYYFFDIVSSLAPSSGLAAGNEVITVVGSGFSTHVSYVLQFQAGGSTQVQSSLGNFMSSTSLTFQKPLWRTAAATSRVYLYSVGQVSQSSTLAFIFQSHWEQIDVSSAPARGGQPIHIRGYGFRPGTMNDYQCQFSQGSKFVFSPAQSSPKASAGVSITCEIPHWPLSFGPVSFQLNLYPAWQQDDPTFVGTYGDCVSYNSGSNIGWCAVDDVCETCARSCERECALAGLGETEQVVHYKYGIQSALPSISCREVKGSCACAKAILSMDSDDEGFFTGIKGVFSDGDGDYESRSHCEWLISATTEISLRFTEFSTESGYDFVTIYRCSSANCTDEHKISSLSGQSVGTGTSYTSSSGWMKVVFTSDDIENGPGFKALVTFADLKSQEIPHDGLNLTSAVIDLQQGMEGLTTTSGPSQGGNVVRIAAFGLDVTSSSYECLFFRKIDSGWENMSTSANAVSSSSLQCLAPAWGSNFPSGNVLVRIRMDGLDIEASTCELNAEVCSYLFWTSWDPRASGPHIISGSYSSTLKVRGFGFSTSSKYSCTVSSGVSSVVMDAEAEVLSTTELLCMTNRFWHTRSILDGIVEILEFPVEGGSRSVCSTCCNSECQSRCHRFECGFDVVNSTGITGLLGVSGGSVLGGSTVTVKGFGFDQDQAYAARFTAEADSLDGPEPRQVKAKNQGVFQVLSRLSDKMHEPVERGLDYLRNPEEVITGSVHLRVAQRPGHFSVISRELVSRSQHTLEFIVPAWTRVRQKVILEVLTENNERIQHAIEGEQGAVFHNENVHFFFFSEMISIREPVVLDRFGGDNIAIQGQGFYNGEYSCQLILTGISSGPGSINSGSGAGEGPASESYSAPGTQEIVSVYAMDKTQIFCIVPPFDTTTSFKDYQAQQATVRLHERQENGTWALVFARTPVHVQVVQINRAPSFIASRLTFTTNSRAGDVVVANFTEHVRPGADAFGNEVKTEFTQRVSFRVEIISGNQLFSSRPVLHANGTAVFSMIAHKYGIFIMNIVLRDDGGTDYGGKNVSTQTVAVDIQQSAAVIVEDHPDGEAVEVLEVFEAPDGTQKNLVPRFRPRILSQVYFSLFQRTSFSVWIPEISSLYFSQLPAVSADGALSFKLLPGAFGFAELFVNITTKDITTGIAQESYARINVSILPLNAEPVFRFNTSNVIELEEDQCSAQSCEILNVATNVSTSPAKMTGPRGENWPEVGQQLTFVLISHKTEILSLEGISKHTADLSDLFSGIPFVHASNGSLIVKMVPHVSGRSTLEFFIKDDGGDANGGVDRSFPQTIVVQVDPIDDAPYGLLECGNADKCLASCHGSLRTDQAGSSLDDGLMTCNLTISVYLGNQRLGECFTFTFRNFVTGIFQPVDEAHQTSFVGLVLTSPSDSQTETFLLQEQPTAKVINGTAQLSLCALQNSSGKLAYDVLLEDDSGGPNVFLAGNVLFDIQPSNRAPSFELCAACVDASEKSYYNLGRCCGGTVTAQEGSGRVTVAGFASNISAGRVFTMKGVTDEDQTISFSVSVLSIEGEEFETSDSSYMFTESGAPSVLPDGTLSFELVQGRYGKVEASVWISDDGGTAFDGVNVSRKVVFDLYVFSLLASLNFTITGDNLNLESSENLEALRSFMAHELDVPLDLLQVTVVRKSGKRSFALRDKAPSISSPSHTFIGRRLLEVQTYQVIVAFLGWSIVKVMEQIKRVPDTLQALQQQYGLADVNLTNTPDIIKASALQSTFDVKTSHIILLETSVEQEQVLESFFVNISQSNSVYLPCEAYVICSGPCECPPSSSASSGRISDGTGNYLPKSECSWVIATGSDGLLYPCSEILINFEQFDTEKGYDTVKVFACTSQDCSSRSEVVTLDGNENTCNSDNTWADSTGNKCFMYDLNPGSCHMALLYAVDAISARDKCCACNGGVPNNLKLTRQYKSSTGHLQIVFRSDEVEQRAGFVASWRTSEKGGREVILLGSTGNLAAISTPSVIPICLPLCARADLLLVTLPFLHGTAIFNFTLGKLDMFERSVTITVTSVNDAPTFSFVAAHIQVPESINSSDTRLLAVNISKGPSLKSLVRNEDHQNLTFRLDLLDDGGVQGFIANSSWVDTNGMLNLPPFFAGPLKFKLTLLDDGGNLNGGRSSSSQNVSLFVIPVNQPPSFTLLNKSVLIFEAGLSHVSSRSGEISLPLTSHIEKGPLRPYLGQDEESQTLSFHLSAHNLTMKSLLLENITVDADTGYLQLLLKPYQNGKVIFDLVLFDSAKFNNASRAQSFELEVQSVNDPPKFQLIANYFDDIEYQQTAQSTEMRHIQVATGITAGPPLSFQIGNEEHQELSFTLVPLNLIQSSALFETRPKVYSNGTMELLLKPYVNGMAMFSLTLADDGREGSPHANVSLPQQFTIHIKAINNEPRFALTSDFFQALEVELTTRLLHFLVASNISTGPPFELRVVNEDYQRVTFTVTPLNDIAASKALFESVQMHSNGTLDLILIPYANGVAKYSVSLSDDGDTALGGRVSSQSANISIQIFAVNNPPFFEVQPLLTLNETADLYLTVVKNFATFIGRGPPSQGGSLPEQWIFGNEVGR
jgi:hypothetical protein